MRLKEHEARTLLLIHAVEDTDHTGVLLPTRTRAAATRRVFDAGEPSTDDLTRLRTRAALLRDDLLREAPALEHVLQRRQSGAPLVLATLAVATALGVSTNLFGPARHVSVLAFPLASIVVWNLVVYFALVVRAIGHAVARARGSSPVRSRLARVARWLEGMRLSALTRRLGASPRSAAVTAAIERFERLWLVTVAPLVAARVRVVLHLAALAMAIGATAGMYMSGIAFEYRATWESTWLEAPAVQRYVDVVLAPAARVLRMPIPDVAPLRGPGGDGNAAPWIHLWATTLGLFVVIPRSALALIDAVTAARLARWLPVHVERGYAQRALHSGRGAATVVEIVYYSVVLDSGLRARLHTMLQEQAGARAVIRDGAHLDYGDDPERVTLPDAASVSGIVAVVFALAQTPEPEVHGEFLASMQERLYRTNWQMMIVLETAVYRERAGSGERVRERRATWDRLLRNLELTAVELA